MMQARSSKPSCRRGFRHRNFTALTLMAGLVLSLLSILPAAAQNASQQPETNGPAPSNSSKQPPAEEAPPEAGGPGGSNGSIALPKKPEKQEAPPPPPQEPVIKNPPGLQNFSLSVNVPEVTLDVGVILQKTHQFVPNLEKSNFQIYENGVPQNINSFRTTHVPITAVLLCEFASTNYWFIWDMRNATYAFAQQLQPNDYVAVITYAMHTHILTDFTQNKSLVYEALNSLVIPGFSETNLFDALYQTLDRLTRIEGRKYIILISSGIDTFSKINLDQILKKIKETPNVTIFSVGTGQAARLTGNAYGGMFGPHEIDYLQADNQLSTFARMTGGMSFFPRFEGAMPDIFREINESIRNRYVLTYTPTDSKLDGSYRKIRVELIDNEGKPLKMQDQKHHPLKYEVICRDGYRAKKQVE